MSTKIKPNIYMSGMQWSCRSSNKIDTVQMQPISNTVPSELVGIASQKITAGKIGNSSAIVTFADVSDEQASTYRHSVCNTVNALFGVQHECAKGLVTCIMASGSIDITTDEAISGIPVATLKFNGNTLATERGKKGYGYFPSRSDLESSNFNLHSWIINTLGQDNIKTKTLSWRYGGNACAFNPWVYRFVQSSGNESFTTADDVATTWYTSKSGTKPFVGWWKDEQNVSQIDATPSEMQPVGSYQPTDALRVRNISVPISVSVSKRDDFTFTVHWQIPIRFSYVAASRYYTLIGGYHDIDNYAFTDMITDVEISLSGRPLSDDPVDIAYSLDGDNNLTPILRNESPLKIPKVECFTASTGYSEGKIITKTYTKNDLDLKVGLYNNSAEYHYENTHFCTRVPVSINPGDTLYIRLEGIRTRNNTNIWLMKDNEFIKVYEPSRDSGSVTVTNIPSDITGVHISFTKYDVDTISLVIVTGKYVSLWSSALASKLLTKYKNGKYVVTVEVNAQWAIKENIHVGTRANVYLQNGQPITRNNAECLFEVKNIEKRFEGSKFIYELKLLEV